MTRGKTSNDSATPVASRGWVAFVGSGPGDPGLLTVRAADLIREADVVITESPDHEALIRAVRGGPASSASSEAGPELVEGGVREEALACAKAGHGFEVVPGVSSLGSVPAYAGIPLTTKDRRELTVVTCRDKVDWSRHGGADTLVL